MEDLRMKKISKEKLSIYKAREYPKKVDKIYTVLIKSCKGYEIRLCKANGQFYLYKKTDKEHIRIDSDFRDIEYNMERLVAKKEIIASRKSLIGKKVLLNRVPHGLDKKIWWTECKIVGVSEELESFDVQVRIGKKYHWVSIFGLSYGSPELGEKIKKSVINVQIADKAKYKANSDHNKLCKRAKEVA